MRTSLRTTRGGALPAPITPRPPASLTAAASSAVATHAIPPWMIGYSMPSMSHSGVRMVMATLLKGFRPFYHRVPEMPTTMCTAPCTGVWAYDHHAVTRSIHQAGADRPVFHDFLRTYPTLAPTCSTLAPAGSTLAPVCSTLAPVCSTLAPACSTLAPACSTLTPLSSVPPALPSARTALRRCPPHRQEPLSLWHCRLRLSPWLRASLWPPLPWLGRQI